MKKNILTIDALNVSKLDRKTVERFKEGGVTAIHLCVGIWENTRDTLSQIGDVKVFVRKNNDIVMLIDEARDIKIAEQENKLGIILGTQNTSPIENELSLVEIMSDVGIKIMQLTYNNQNLVGAGKFESNDNGLSRFGKLVVEEMNRVGMIIDLSHVGIQTSIDTIEHSKRPVAITHANPQWLYPVPRNVPKEVMTKLKENNGIIGLSPFPNMMSGSGDSIEDFVEMVAQTVEFMGINNVGIGTDLIMNRDDEFMIWANMGKWTHDRTAHKSQSKGLSANPQWPNWFSGPEDFPNLSEAMFKKGFSEKEVRAIMGENWLDFFEMSFKQE